MHDLPALPVHPTRKHPLTGDPLRAIWVRPDGHVCWPIMGGAPDDPPADPPSDPPADPPSDVPPGNAVDDKGRDLGYPKDTRVAEMTAQQQAAYWQHQSQKHEGRYKNLVGDRSFDDARKDLDEISEIRKSQQTPAEQAITEAREQGKAEARAEATSKAATAIFRASLEAQGHKPADVDELVGNFTVANFITDGEVDTEKLATFAKRFAPAGTATDRRRDFGGGDRSGGGGAPAGLGGSAEADRRFGKQE